MTALKRSEPDGKPAAAAWCDRRLGPFMFWLSLVFLVVAAGVLHRVGQGFSSYFEFEVIAWGLFVIWPVFLVEGSLRIFLCVRRNHVAERVGYAALVALAPPLRMGGRAYADAGRIWLPRAGWCTVDRHLRRRLEQFFSVPMMVIAFLVLPVLALEHFWAEEVRRHFAASLFLDIASSVIWMAFAAEFILMVSVADKKLRYCLQNWMDLAIVVLPLIDFMPLLRLLRLTRLLELQQFARLGRMYRLRGLAIKLWRAVLILDIVNRLVGQRKQKRLERLKELLAAKTEEIDDLKKEIAELERDLAKAKVATEAASPASPAASAMVLDEALLAPLATPLDRPAVESHPPKSGAAAGADV